MKFDDVAIDDNILYDMIEKAVSNYVDSFSEYSKKDREGMKYIIVENFDAWIIGEELDCEGVNDYNAKISNILSQIVIMNPIDFISTYIPDYKQEDYIQRYKKYARKGVYDDNWQALFTDLEYDSDGVMFAVEKKYIVCRIYD